MSDYLVLTRTLLKCGLGGNSSGSSRGGNGAMSLLFSIACMIPLIGMLVTSLTSACAAAIAAGDTGFSFVEQGLAMGMTVALVVGTTMVISTFYTSSDITTLTALPLPATTIAGAKLTICLLYDYSLVLWATAPALIAYGMASGAGAAYWVLAVVICALLPLTPLVYGGIIVMLIMRAFRRIRNKQVLTIVGFVLTGVVVCFMLYASISGQQGDAAGMERSLAVFGRFAFLYPNLAFANAALFRISVVDALLFALTVAALVAVFLLVARSVYFKSVVGMSETTSHRGALSKRESGSFGRQRDVMTSYVHLEQIRILRSPTYLVQGVLLSLIWPGMVIMTLIMASQQSDGEDIVGAIAASAGGEVTPLVLMLLAIGVTVLTTSTNKVSGTAISREGAALSLMKTFPVSYRTHIEAKVRSNLLPSFVLGDALPIVAAVFCTVHGASPLGIVLVAVVGFLAVMAVNYLQILFDLRSPQLQWTDDAQPMRQSSLLFSSFASIGMGIALVAAGVGLGFLLNLPVTLTVACTTALTAAVAFGLRAATLRYGEKRLAELS